MSGAVVLQVCSASKFCATLSAFVDAHARHVGVEFFDIFTSSKGHHGLLIEVTRNLWTNWIIQKSTTFISDGTVSII